MNRVAFIVFLMVISIFLYGCGSVKVEKEVVTMTELVYVQVPKEHLVKYKHPKLSGNNTGDLVKLITSYRNLLDKTNENTEALIRYNAWIASKQSGSGDTSGKN